MPFYDLTGKRFGFLIAMRWLRHAGYSSWECRCDCGTTMIARADYLRSGEVKSCGCKSRALHNAALGHDGRAKTKLYKLWSQMKGRCHTPTDAAYPGYGGRGIRVCDRWRSSFASFVEDMGPRPAGTTLDRIDNDGNYEPANCRWATWRQQQRNKRNSRIVEAFGERKTLVEWSEDHRCQCSLGTLWHRLKSGRTPERAITAPLRHQNPYRKVQHARSRQSERADVR
jgi:hypothetical protein